MVNLKRPIQQPLPPQGTLLAWRSNSSKGECNWPGLDHKVVPCLGQDRTLSIKLGPVEKKIIFLNDINAVLQKHNGINVWKSRTETEYKVEKGRRESKIKIIRQKAIVEGKAGYLSTGQEPVVGCYELNPRDPTNVQDRLCKSWETHGRDQITCGSSERFEISYPGLHTEWHEAWRSLWAGKTEMAK